MKIIALIQPKIHFEDNYPCSWIPFSILSIGSSLPRDRYDVRLFDENRITKSAIFRELAGKDVLMAGLSVMTGGGQIRNALEISEQMRKEHPEAKIVFGGAHVNVLPEQTAENHLVDYAVCGMGQECIVALAECIEADKPADDIAGIYYREGNNIVSPSKKTACVSSLTPYDFSLIDPVAYIKYDATISDKTLNYIASQGCPYGCRFCYECSYNKKYYNMRSEFVKRDIEFYAKKFGVNGVKFYDADFFVNDAVCGSIIDTLCEYNMKWAASVHPNDILRNQRGASNALLRSISKSNCTRLLMGMESGSDRILNEVIGKKANAGDYLTIAKEIAEHGIIGSYTFMVGFPDETLEEQNKTFELIRRLWEVDSAIETKIHIYLPYPGTPLYEQSIALGHKPPKHLEEWSDYNYYKSMTVWTDAELEKKAAEYTRMIDKNKRKNV